MCNLNIIIKKRCSNDISKVKKSLEVAKIYSFLCGVTRNSFELNDEGDGIYLSNEDKKDKGVLIKGKKKRNYDNMICSIRDSSFIITHQRIATSGKTAEYTQPFENVEFVLAHNGVMLEFVEENHSDTYVFFNKFVKEFKKSGRKTRSRKVVGAIKKLLDGKSGLFSIVIYDKKEKAMYYFKNSYARISFHRSTQKKFLYISTNDDNNIFLKIFPQKFEEFDIDARTIYKITVNDKIKIYPVGEIVDYVFVSNVVDTDNERNDNKMDLSKFCGINDTQNLDAEDQENFLDQCRRDDYEEDDVILDNIKQTYQTFVTANAGYCRFCSVKTYNIESVTSRRVCDECYIKNSELDEDIQDALDYARDWKQKNTEKNRKRKVNTKGGGKNGVRDRKQIAQTPKQSF